MKRALIITLVIMLAVLTACSGSEEVQQDRSSEQKKETTIDNTEESAEENAVENNEMKPITMRINDEEVEVTWEDNESVRALSDLVSGSPLTIESSMYGGFEQVGSIGTSLPSNDVNMRTEAGDIALYSDSNMVVFYGSNSWSYTMLGHIENKSAEELADLLGGSDVTITLLAE